THELDLARAPAHELRYRELADGRFDDAGEMLRERLALLLRAVDEILALLVPPPLELLRRDAAGAREAGERCGRIAVRIERRLHRRPLALNHALRLAREHAGHAHGEAPWRGEALDLAALAEEMLRPQAVGDLLRERPGETL